MTRSDDEGVFHHDAEMMGAVDAHLLNTSVQNISWEGIEVTVKDRETKQPKSLIHRVDGLVEAGTGLSPLFCLVAVEPLTPHHQGKSAP